MVCIYCGQPTSVANSRRLVRSNKVWRRRACEGCDSVFTTLEAPDVSLSVVLSKGGLNGRLEPLLRDKLFISLYESCKHRPTAIKDAEALTTTVLAKALKNIKNGVLLQKNLEQTALEALTRFDKVAAVHYRAYYSRSS